MLPDHLDHEIGERPQQLRVIRADTTRAGAVVVPRLVVEPRIGPERRHHRLEIVSVLAADVLLHEGHARLNCVCTDRHSPSPRDCHPYGFPVVGFRPCFSDVLDEATSVPRRKVCNSVRLSPKGDCGRCTLAPDGGCKCAPAVAGALCFGNEPLRSRQCPRRCSEPGLGVPFVRRAAPGTCSASAGSRREMRPILAA